MISRFVLHPLTRKVTHWLLVAVILLYGITGYGITQYRIVELSTLGLLTKPLSFKIHDNLLIPLLVLLALHIYHMVGPKLVSKQ